MIRAYQLSVTDYRQNDLTPDRLVLSFYIERNTVKEALEVLGRGEQFARRKDLDAIVESTYLVKVYQNQLTSDFVGIQS